MRKYLGYRRLDYLEVVPMVNELYEVLEVYLNHFQTVRRTVEKNRVGAKYIRKYEKVAKTPYQRMLEHPEVAEEVKQQLRTKHDQLNPLLLKQEIDTLLTKIMRLQKNDQEPRR